MSLGYVHPDYAASFAEFGHPRLLPRAGGWLLERPIPGSELRDAMGCYPLFCCERWSALGDDLEELASELVSVVVVTEPFCPLSAEELARSFDRVVPFKEHFVAELGAPLDEIVQRPHRRSVRRAQRTVEVNVCPRPWEHLERWVELFEILKERHGIRGLRAFSRSAFELQLRIPGMVMFEARCGGETVGLDLWYEQGEVAYGHLVAFSDAGYAAQASYATKWAVLEYFTDRVRWVDFGGGAGARGDSSPDDGLSRFKRGWSNAVRKVHLCGRVLRPEAYAALAEERGADASAYFPAYRAGELT